MCVCFIADLFAVRYLWDVCNEDKCCAVTHPVADILVASLSLFTWRVYIRTYCVPIATLNQNKLRISITLFGRRPNNKVRNLTSHGRSNIQELLMLRCLDFPLTLFGDRIESVQ